MSVNKYDSSTGTLTPIAGSGGGGQTIQVEELPTATAALVGKVYQYIGETNSEYTHGYFYECINNNGTYSWENIPVQVDDAQITSTDPYTFRQGKGNLADMEIVGASVGWNQLVQNGNFASTSNWTANRGTISISNNKATFTSTTTSDDAAIRQATVKSTVGHKYLICASLTPSKASKAGIHLNGQTKNLSTMTANKKNTFEMIINSTGTTAGNGLFVYCDRDTIFTSDDTCVYENVNCIDLTLLLGSTISDAIYAMEQATAGAGVAFFRKYFPKDYYAYDAGSIQSVSVGSRKVVGKNLFDSANVLNGYLNSDAGKISSSSIGSKTVFCRLTKGVYTVQKTQSLRFIYALFDEEPVIGSKWINGTFVEESASNTTATFIADHDCWFAMFCVSGSSSEEVAKANQIINSIQIEYGSTATSYEPYTSTVYPFDSTKELRGLFSLEGGELKANGDVWRGDEIQRKYMIVDLGTLDWTYSSTYERFKATLPSQTVNGQSICSKYVISNAAYVDGDRTDKVMYNYGGNVYVRDFSYTDAATFKTAMSGVYLIAEAATPTTESTQPYQNPQRAYIDGTEEFTDGLTRDVMIPVGNSTTYSLNAVLPDAEDYADGVGAQKVGWAEHGVLGSKNFCDPNYIRETDTVNNVTITNNGDGTVSLSGTANATGYIRVFTNLPLKPGKYIWSCENNNDGLRVFGWISSSSSTEIVATTSGSCVEFTAPDSYDSYHLYLRVVSGKQYSATIYPMIRLADDPDQTYVPHAKTNRQLTTDKAEVSAIGTDESGRTTASKAYAVGDHFYKDGKFCTVISAIASGATLTKNTNYKEGTVADAVEQSAKIDIDPSAATISAYPVGTMYLVTQ